VERTEPSSSGYVYDVRDEAAYLQPEDEKQEVTQPFDPSSMVCQFCGLWRAEASHLFEAKHRVRNPNTDAIASVWICDECVARMAELAAQEPPASRWGLWFWRQWLPGGDRIS
jgi:hypothetical protein